MPSSVPARLERDLGDAEAASSDDPMVAVPHPTVTAETHALREPVRPDVLFKSELVVPWLTAAETDLAEKVAFLVVPRPRHVERAWPPSG